MGQARVAAATDRLPWLEDEPASPPARTRARRELAGWATAALLLVAGASYWMGGNSWEEPAQPPATVQSSETVALPQPREVEAQQPQVVLRPQPEVVPAPQREVPIARPKALPQRGGEAATAEQDHKPQGPAAPATTPVAAPNFATAMAAAPSVAAPAPATVSRAPAAIPQALTPWPAWQSQGAQGRIVRIGAYGSRQQAKLGWRYMVRSYPAVARLKATVVETRNSRGRRFYRFQIGTTSQAHSEVLCQRMEKIRLSCAVVGLPWKPRGVER